MNKLRYKNGKGNPRGFVAFLDDRHISHGVLPQYRGNRLREREKGYVLAKAVEQVYYIQNSRLVLPLSFRES